MRRCGNYILLHNEEHIVDTVIDTREIAVFYVEGNIFYWLLKTTNGKTMNIEFKTTKECMAFFENFMNLFFEIRE